MPVSGRVERLFSGSTESILFPYSGTPHRGISPAQRFYRDRCRQPCAGQRHHPAYVLCTAQPDVPVELRADSRIWLEWAAGHGIHPYVYDYICFRPDQLWSQPSKTEEPFSSPRSWHMLSDAIISYGDSISEQELAVLANGCLTAAHAAQFVAYVRQVRQAYSITKIINGTQNWPDEPEERDVLYFLAQSFRAQLLKELPHNRGKLTSATQTLTLRAKELLVELAGISLEIAQMAITPEDGETLPAWFIVEVTRDLPALTKKKMG